MTTGGSVTERLNGPELFHRLVTMSPTRLCDSVLAPVPGVRYECVARAGHDSLCTDAGRTVTW